MLLLCCRHYGCNYCCVSQIIVDCCLPSLSNQLSNSYVSPCFLLHHLSSRAARFSTHAAVGSASSSLDADESLARAVQRLSYYVVAFGLRVVHFVILLGVICGHDGQFVFSDVSYFTIN